MRFPKFLSKSPEMPSIHNISSSQSSIRLAKTPYAGLTDRAPSMVNRVFSFELRGASCALANGIRRTLISEMPVRHLTVSLSDIKTTDPYIIGDAIRKRVEMIPIGQSMDLSSVFSAQFENKSDMCMDVPSSAILLNGATRSSGVSPDIPICDINSGTSFSLHNIRVIESYGYDNARQSIGRVAYEILDQDFSQPSISTDPSNFRIEVETPGIIDPKEMIVKAIKCLIGRLRGIDHGNSVTEFDIFKLSIPNETHTIGNLISRYIYHANPTIDYVANRVLHPSSRNCVVDVRHENGSDLCAKAAEAAAADLEIILGALK